MSFGGSLLRMFCCLSVFENASRFITGVNAAMRSRADCCGIGDFMERRAGASSIRQRTLPALTLRGRGY